MDKKILIIEDNEQDQKIVKRYLERMGCDNVIFADTGEKGFEIVKSEKPQLVVLDTKLPGMDGFETCKRIKSIEGCDIKVIVITGHVDAVDAGRARQHGADDYCVKTSDCAPLLRAIKNLL